MTAKIISRAEAMAQGLPRYFTGKLCKYGHVAERFSPWGECVECSPIRDKKRKSLEQYRESKRKWDKEYRAVNPEKCSAILRKWYEKNSDSWKASVRKWRSENPERVRAHGSNRRALKRLAAGSHTADQILDLFKKQKGKCAGCRCSIKRGYHIDHITALSKGGSNDISNIQLLCQPCNNGKYNKDPIVWAQQNGRLI